ncbi:MAG: type II secretion system protein [Candidatus Nanopelagicaceae bacterium]
MKKSFTNAWKSRLLKLKQNDDSGFTLIELLVVIIILGILASIVIVSISTARGSAVEKACKTDAVNLRQAIDQYYIDNNGSYPTAAGAAYTATELGVLTTNQKYLRSLPPIKGDATGKDYYLTVTVTAGVPGAITGYSVPAGTGSPVCSIA